MIWRGITYDWPDGAFLLLVTLSIVWVFFMLYRYRQNQLDAFADLSIRDLLIKNRLPAYFWTKVSLCAIVWIGGVLALMQPKGNERYTSDQTTQLSTKPNQPMQQIIILLDASASMGVTDSRNRNSRLEVAKGVIDSIISHLQGEQVALIAFTSATLPIVPLTTDYLFTRMMTEQIEINEGETAGTDIKQALAFVSDKYLKNVFPTISKTLIILSDGGDTHLETLQGSDASNYVKQIILPLTETGLEKLNLIVVSLGSKRGGEVPQVRFHENPVESVVNLNLLQQISTSRKGILLNTEELSSQQVAEAISGILQRQAVMETTTQPQPSQQISTTYLYDLYYQIPLGISLIALMLFMCLPDTHKKHVGSILLGKNK